MHELVELKVGKRNAGRDADLWSLVPINSCQGEPQRLIRASWMSQKTAFEERGDEISGERDPADVMACAQESAGSGA
jgi:hypothetical protein